MQKLDKPYCDRFNNRIMEAWLKKVFLIEINFADFRNRLLNLYFSIYTPPLHYNLIH